MTQNEILNSETLNFRYSQLQICIDLKYRVIYIEVDLWTFCFKLLVADLPCLFETKLNDRVMGENAINLICLVLNIMWNPFFVPCSLFIKECLEEFYMTYDDNSLRWNGADLLTRVAQKFVGEENKTIKQLELNKEPSHVFYPINSHDITR